MEREATEFELGMPGIGKGRSKWDVVLDVRKAIDAALERFRTDGDIIWVLSLKLFREVAGPSANAVYLQYRADPLTPEQWRARYESRAPARKPRSAVSEKYLLVTQRDVLQEGDQYHDMTMKEWLEVDPEYAGRQKGDVFRWFEKVRRLK